MIPAPEEHKAALQSYENKAAQLASDLSAAREEIAELRKAAEPFAYMSAIISNNLRHQLPDDAVIFSEEGDSQAWLTIGNFRRLVSARSSSRTKGQTP